MLLIRGCCKWSFTCKDLFLYTPSWNTKGELRIWFAPHNHGRGHSAERRNYLIYIPWRFHWDWFNEISSCMNQEKFITGFLFCMEFLLSVCIYKVSCYCGIHYVFRIQMIMVVLFVCLFCFLNIIYYSVVLYIE